MDNQILSIQRENGSSEKVLLRIAGPSDRDALVQMYTTVSDREQSFFIDDIRHPSTFVKWFEPNDLQETLSIVAESNGILVGEAAIIRQKTSRTSHVGNVRIFIQPDWRSVGLGPQMVSLLFTEALKMGIQKISISIPEPADKDFRILLEKTGFAREAVLKNHYKTESGISQAIIMYGRDLEELWNRIADWVGNYGRVMEY